MSEELGVSSEELAAMLRRCSDGFLIEDCKGCQLENDGHCFGRLMHAVADELERLTKELKGANHE